MKKYFKKFREYINNNLNLTTGVALIIISISAVFITHAVSGCRYYTDGSGQDTVKLTDEVTGVLDTASDLAPVVQDVLVGASVAFPVAAGVLGVVAGVIGAFTGAYKKYRPQITREHDKAVQAGNITKAVVYAIEQYKLSNPDNWDDLKNYLKSEFKDKVSPEALAVVEALIYGYSKETK